MRIGSGLIRINAIFLCVAVFAWAVGFVIAPQEWNSRDCMHQTYLLTGLFTWFLMTQCVVIEANPLWLERFIKEPKDRMQSAHKTFGWCVLFFLALHMFFPVSVLVWPVTQVPIMADHDMSTFWRALWIWSHPLAGASGIIVAGFAMRLFWLDIRKKQRKLSWLSWFKAHKSWVWLYLCLVPHVLRCLREYEMMMPIGWLVLCVSAIGVHSCIHIIKEDR